MKTDQYYLVFVRPVGSGCWTVERIARRLETAEAYAKEARARLLEFADGGVLKQSTAIVACLLPAERCEEQRHYPSLREPITS